MEAADVTGNATQALGASMFVDTFRTDALLTTVTRMKRSGIREYVSGSLFATFGLSAAPVGACAKQTEEERRPNLSPIGGAS
jgi:hypothetical protein